MTGRERVKAAVTFSKPDRVPRDLWTLPYISLFRQEELDEVLEKYPIDINRIEMKTGPDARDIRRLAKPGTYVDEWGSIWQLGEAGVVGEVKKPILEDWSALDRLLPPWDTIKSIERDHVNRICGRSDNFMLSAICARPFERLQFLRGSENLYLDLAYGTSRVRKLMDMVHDFYLESVTVWTGLDVDALFMMDDWGTNHSLLINPELWRQLFMPLYKEYCDIIHGKGKYVFFHSDGHIASIYEDLINIGVDALNSQLFCMDIENLGEKFKGKVTFWGEIDRQHVLISHRTEDVREAVKRVRRSLDNADGGVIAQCEWGKGNTKENIEAVFKAWL